MNKKIIIIITMVILSALIVTAWSTSNVGNLHVQGWLNVSNASETSVFAGNITAAWIDAKIEYSNIQNPSSGGGYTTSINLTSTTYNGSLSSGSYTGYSAGNAICNASFSGSEMCSQFDAIRWFSNADSPNLNDDAWVHAGGPKYVPATIPVDDCNGWTYGDIGSHLGNYWHFNSTNGGEGRALNCLTKFKLACCSYD